MLNINSKLQTLFATGRATGGTIIPARQSMARLATVLFVLITAMFILTGCGLGSLINAARTGNLPCNLNPFQTKCYPEITEELLAGAATVNLTDEEIADETPQQKADREASIARRAAQEAARKEALAKYAPQRQALIEPVVAECTVNPLAARCRDAFVWCSDFENTNSPECASALAAQTGVFSCLKDPYNEACEQQTALQETISGQVPVRDANGDIELDENGEEMTELKEVSLVENTRQARINYCRDTNDAGEANIDANPVLCESTVTNVCEDPENPSGVFDVFCKDAPGVTDYADERLRIATTCRNDETPTLAEGCTSVVNFCNETPFGNSNCDIPAFAPARLIRVELCIDASTAAQANACGVELANNPCFGDPFVDGVDCASELNLGSPENVTTAQQNRSLLCVNAFIASRYPDICGGASATECVANPFGECEDSFGGTDEQTSARQERALYCVIGTKTTDPLCLGIQTEACFIDPAHDDCTEFFGGTYQFVDSSGELQMGKQQDRAQGQRGVYCANFLETEGKTETSTLCEATIVRYCETGQNLFTDSDRTGTPACLSREDFDDKRLQFVNECRSGMRTTECGGENSVINACNSEPFGSYVDDPCAPKHFDDARADKIAACLVTGATGCEVTFGNPNAATWAKSFSDNSTPLVALNTNTPENQFLLGTADGIDTPSNVTATLLTIEDDAKNGVGFFTASSKFYAGLFSGANLGKPLNDATQAGEWTGSLQATVDANISAVLPMTLTVTYANNGGTIKAFVPSGSNHFLLEGDFTANGVITNGTVNYGIFAGGVETAPAAVTRGANGILMGLIGQDGALGAFHSDENETNGYAGGFVATKPNE